MTKQRSSNFEFLRIIAMIMIVFHHFSVHGNFSFATDSITFNRLWIQFLAIGGKIGVNIFPVTFKRWWFASTYFVLYLLSPYISTALRCITKKMYQQLLITMFIIWCLIPTFTDSSYQSNNLLWFIFLFALAGYIRLYNVSNCSGKKYIILGVLNILLTFLTVIIIDYLMLYKIALPVIGKNFTYFYGMQMITTLFNALFLFLGFKNTQMRYSPFINTVASAAFGVYLIHDHIFFRNYLWKELFINNQYSYDPYLAIYSIIIVLLVFTICTCIDLLRINTIEKLWIKLLHYQ